MIRGVLFLGLTLLATGVVRADVGSFADVIDSVQPKIVKIYGAGGLRGLEAYQSGFLISADGYVLTVLSYVLDSDYLAVVLNDGRRFDAVVTGSDPMLEIAVLKLDATDLPFFELERAVPMETGGRVLAFSNLFGVATGNEPASVQHGVIAATSKLQARKGAFQSKYDGLVYILDAMTNNPGAAGGALTDRSGRLAGLLGKELRSSQTNIWLNYAIPIKEIAPAAKDILAGKLRPLVFDEEARKPREPMSLPLLGIVLVPDVVAKTPPFIDSIVPGSPADKAGLQPDDLILYMNDGTIDSCASLREGLSFIDRIDNVELVLQRGDELITVRLRIP